MHKMIVSAALAAATLVSAPAFAQDAPASTAVSGPRAELLLGYDAHRFVGEKEHGVLYGVGVGYDVAVSSSVSLGLDAEATDSTAKFGDAIDYIAASRDLYAGARASFAVSDKTNVYVKGGYTNARFVVSDNFGTDAGNLDGWRAGAGLQYTVSGKFYVGGEYRYSSYDGGDLKRHQFALTAGTRF